GMGSRTIALHFGLRTSGPKAQGRLCSLALRARPERCAASRIAIRQSTIHLADPLHRRSCGFPRLHQGAENRPGVSLLTHGKLDVVQTGRRLLNRRAKRVRWWGGTSGGVSEFRGWFTRIPIIVSSPQPAPLTHSSP